MTPKCALPNSRQPLPPGCRAPNCLPTNSGSRRLSASFSLGCQMFMNSNLVLLVLALFSGIALNAGDRNAELRFAEAISVNQVGSTSSSVRRDRGLADLWHWVDVEQANDAWNAVFTVSPMTLAGEHTAALSLRYKTSGHRFLTPLIGPQLHVRV